MNTYADRLRYALKIRNMSQSELARRVGVKPQAIQYLCREGRQSAHSIKICEVLEINPKWLTDGAGNYEKNEMKEEPLKINDQPDHYTKIALNDIPLVKWHEIPLILNVAYNKQEFETMPMSENITKGTFAILIEDHRYAPYLEPGDRVIIEPVAGSTLGERVLVEMHGHHHIFEHAILEQEYLLPKQQNTKPIPITPQLEYKILGVVTDIYSKRRG